MLRILLARTPRRGGKRLSPLVVSLFLMVGYCLVMIGCGGGDDDAAPARTSELEPAAEVDAATATTAPGETMAQPEHLTASVDTVPAGITAPVGMDTETPVPTREEPEPTRSVPPPPTRVVTGSLGPFCLQMGSFKSRNHAERLAVELEDTGFAVKIVEATVKGTLYYRVYLPNLTTRWDAEQLGERLKSSHGHDYLVRKID